jgi:hypothetical protein
VVDVLERIFYFSGGGFLRVFFLLPNLLVIVEFAAKPALVLVFDAGVCAAFGF